MRRQHPDRPKVRMMSEYGVAYPVWDADGEVATEGEGLRVAGRSVSPQLTDALWSWQRLFTEHYNFDDGWRDLAARDEYAAQGPRLRDRLQAELGRDVDVVLDLWPIAVDGSARGQ